MLFIPYEKFQIVTNLNYEKNKEKMAGLIGDPSDRFSKNNNKPFQGRLENNVFKITRRTEDVSPYFPVILGVIQDNTINGSIRVNFPVLFKMLFGLCAVLAVGVIMFRRGVYLGAVFSLLIIIIGYSMSIAYFKAEAKMAKAILEKFLCKNKNK